MALGQVFSEYFCFLCQFSFHLVLHIHRHHHLSSGAGTIGQLVADVPSGLSLTPPHETRKKTTCVAISASRPPCECGGFCGNHVWRLACVGVVVLCLRSVHVALKGETRSGYKMVYCKGFRRWCITQNYWVFGLSPSSGILKNTREDNVSETGSVSVLRRRGIPDDGQSPKTPVILSFIQNVSWRS
jgi:hypothetical protein